MDPFSLCLWVGFIGLLLMTLLGFGHGSGSHAHANHGLGGHAGHAGARGLGGGGGSRGARLGKGLGAGMPQLLWFLVLPRLIFSLLLGFGAAGLLLRPYLPGIFLTILAIVCAWIFEILMVQPLWRFATRFASNPAKLIDGVLLEEAEAKCNFDSDGLGLVAVEIDGQSRQLLGKLRQEDRQFGARVRAGDRLTVVAVDPGANTCVVARFNPPINLK